MKRIFAVLAVAAASACTIIIDGGTRPPPPIGGGFNPCIDTPEAQSMPIAHLIVDVRIDRTVVNFEDDYARWMRTTVLGLWAAGIRTTRGAMIRLDESTGSSTPLAAWGCDTGGFDPEPQAVIHHWAVQSEGARSSNACALDPLISAGKDLGALVTAYPPEVSNVNGIKAFGDAPDLVVVLHLDSLARKSGLDDAPCAAALDMTRADGDGRATWLNYPGVARDGKRGVPLDRVFHWFVATDEGIDRATFVDRCRRVEGFPVTVLDLLEPSARPLYEPLAAQIAAAGGEASGQPMCRMFAERDRTTFFTRELEAIASAAGTKLDADLLAAALSGEIPGRGEEPPAGP